MRTVLINNFRIVPSLIVWRKPYYVSIYYSRKESKAFLVWKEHNKDSVISKPMALGQIL